MVAGYIIKPQDTPMESRPISEFGHEFGHGRSTRKLCAALGLGRPADARAGIYRDYATGKTWFRWMGKNGRRWRHEFENITWYEMSQTEWDTLKVKVTLSQC